MELGYHSQTHPFSRQKMDTIHCPISDIFVSLVNKMWHVPEEVNPLVHILDQMGLLVRMCVFVS